MADKGYQNITNNDEGKFLVDEELSKDILKLAQNASVCDPFLREFPMVTKKKKINYLSTKLSAYWVGTEATKKTVSTAKFAQMNLEEQELAVIVPFTADWARYANNEVVSFLKEEIVEAFVEKIDKTELGYETDSPFSKSISGDIPAGNTIAYGTYADFLLDLSACMGAVEQAGYVPTGWACPIEMKQMLRDLRDSNGQPIFQPANAQSPDMLYGLPCRFSQNMTTTGSPARKEIICGAWKYGFKSTGTVVEFKIAEEATIQLADSSLVYLFQQDMLALRAFMWKAFDIWKTDAFAKVTGIS